MSSPDTSTDPSKTHGRFAPWRAGRRRLVFAAALLGAVAIGSGVTALALQGRRPTLVMLTPSPIAAMRDWSAVAVKGQVAEIFGSAFVIQDDSGRALVETGPAGDRRPLVAKSEPVTVQGRFDHGVIHAQAISHGDGRNDVVGPAGPGPRGGPEGPMAQRGPAAEPGNPIPR